MTFEELLQGMLDRVPSDVDKRQGSVIYDALAPAAYFLAQQDFQMQNFIDLVFADTAVGEYLDRCVEAHGLSRKPATSAVRKMTTSAAVPVGSRWGINDLVYKVTEEIGSTEYHVTCGTAGIIGNQYTGELQPLSDVSGVTAVLADVITPGVEEETDAALRDRFYQKVRLPATSGNAYHYKLWALQVPGVGDARVFPLDSGPGTVGVLIVDTDKKINKSLEAEVSAYIETVRPIGASVTVGSPDPASVAVTANVLLDGSKLIGEVQESFKGLLSEYLRGLVFVSSRVSYAQIGRILLETPGVQDYDTLRVNGQTGNLTVTDKQIPEMGVVTLSEVRRLAAD